MYLDVHERDTSRYNQDTIRIHHDTSGYVSDRKLHPKTIGNPPSPIKAIRNERAGASASKTPTATSSSTSTTPTCSARLPKRHI